MIMQALGNCVLDPSEERAAIGLLLRYATALDTRDWSLFRSCFTEDVEADYGSLGRWRGPRAITESIREAYQAFGATLHRMSNFTIYRDAGEVRARSYVDAILLSARPGGSMRRDIGWYDDQLVRTSEGWKLSRRTFCPVLLE